MAEDIQWDEGEDINTPTKEEKKAFSKKLGELAMDAGAVESAVIAVAENKLALDAMDVPAITEAVQCNVALSLLERQIIELYATNVSKKVIATKLGIPVNAVNTLFKRKGVQEFASSLIMASNYAIKSERVRLISTIIDAKINLLEEGELDMAYATTKDVVDLTLNLDHILKEKEKKELGVSDGNNVYVNILQQMIDGEDK